MKYEAETGAAVGVLPVWEAPEKEKAKPRPRAFKKVLVLFFASIFMLWLVLQAWMVTAELNIRWAADYPREELSAIVGKTTLNEDDYRTLYMQTGLGKPSVDYLRENGTAADFIELQNNFFTAPAVFCDQNTPVSAEEMVVDGEGNRTAGTKIIGLEDGDILITSCCHTFGWRNGHAALVVDAENHTALESVVMGTDSCLQDTFKWEGFPAFLVLRVKDVPAAERTAIAQNAVEKLNGIPYGLTVGLFSEKYIEGSVTSTHCAHLVWEAYKMYGIDIDSNGGPIVTPKDIAGSPLLEVKQVYGMNPETLWD